jgi:deazaflavin-dependent oxidoreductase (nitroreductase family)
MRLPWNAAQHVVADHLARIEPSSQAWTKSTDAPKSSPHEYVVDVCGVARLNSINGARRTMPYRAPGHYRPPPMLHRLLSSVIGALASRGCSPANTVALEVVGRHTGRVRRTAVVFVEHEGRRFLVSLAGESQWVRNVRAAAGQAILRRGQPVAVRLVEVPPAERPPVLLAYASHRAFGRSPSYIARNYFGVGPDPTLAEFTAMAERYPVFVVEPD